MDSWTEKAIDSLDACMLSGEGAHEADTRALLREHMARWERVMKEWEASEPKFTDKQIAAFKRWVKVQREGRYNMLSPAAHRAARVNDDEIKLILDSYDELAKQVEAS